MAQQPSFTPKVYITTSQVDPVVNDLTLEMEKIPIEPAKHEEAKKAHARMIRVLEGFLEYMVQQWSLLPYNWPKKSVEDIYNWQQARLGLWAYVEKSTALKNVQEMKRSVDDIRSWVYGLNTIIGLWGPEYSGYSAEIQRAKMAVKAHTKDLKNKIRHILRSAYPRDKEMAAKWSADVSAEKGVKVKKGDLVHEMDPVPPGGNVEGFRVVNKVGVTLPVYRTMGDFLGKVRQLLGRRGLNNATANIPITYVHDSEGMSMEEIPGVQSKGISAGLYHPSSRSISIMFSDIALTSVAGYVENWMLDVLIHEIGHYYWYNRLPAAAKAKYAKAHALATEFPSSYARKDEGEDFAETFAAYVGAGARAKSYVLTPQIWTRFMAAVEMDPKLKELKMRAEAREWEDALVDALAEAKVKDVVGWERDFSHHLAESEADTGEYKVSQDIAKSLHALVKNNGGFFKSEAQAKFLIDKARYLSRGYGAFESPTKYHPGFSSANIAFTVKTLLEQFGHKTSSKIRYFAYGFILDGSGVLVRVKLKVNVVPGTEAFGRIDWASGVVDFTRPAGSKGPFSHDWDAADREKEVAKQAAVAKNAPLIAQLKSIPGWDNPSSMEGILGDFVRQLEQGRTLSPKQLDIANKYFRKAGIASLEQDWQNWEGALHHLFKMFESSILVQVMQEYTAYYNDAIAKRDKWVADNPGKKVDYYMSPPVTKNPPTEAKQMWLKALDTLRHGGLVTIGENYPYLEHWFMEICEKKGYKGRWLMEALSMFVAAIDKAKRKKRVLKDQASVVYDMMKLAKGFGYTGA